MSLQALTGLMPLELSEAQSCWRLQFPSLMSSPGSWFPFQTILTFLIAHISVPIIQQVLVDLASANSRLSKFIFGAGLGEHH